MLRRGALGFAFDHRRGGLVVETPALALPPVDLLAEGPACFVVGVVGRLRRLGAFLLALRLSARTAATPAGSPGRSFSAVEIEFRSSISVCSSAFTRNADSAYRSHQTPGTKRFVFARYAS